MKKVKHLKGKLTAYLIIVSMLLLQFTYVFADDTKRVAKITDYSGTVNIIKAGGEKKYSAFKSMSLIKGDTISTGEDSWVELEIDDDKIVKISENTKIGITELAGSVSSGDDQTGLSLWFGDLFTSVKKRLNADAKYEVRTPKTVMGVRGTQFFVCLSDNKTLIAVVEGRVYSLTYSSEEQPDGTVLEQALETYINKDEQSVIDANVSASSAVTVQPVDLKSMPLPLLEQIRNSPDGVDPALVEQLDSIIEEKKAEEAKKEKPADPTPTKHIIQAPEITDATQTSSNNNNNSSTGSEGQTARISSISATNGIIYVNFDRELSALPASNSFTVQKYIGTSYEDESIKSIDWGSSHSYVVIKTPPLQPSNGVTNFKYIVKFLAGAGQMSSNITVPAISSADVTISVPTTEEAGKPIPFTISNIKDTDNNLINTDGLYNNSSFTLQIESDLEGTICTSYVIIKDGAVISPNLNVILSEPGNHVFTVSLNGKILRNDLQIAIYKIDTPTPTIIGNVGFGDRQLYGITEPGSTITVKRGSLVVGTGTTIDESSKYYSVILDNDVTLATGESLEVYATAPYKNISNPATVTVTSALAAGLDDSGMNITSDSIAVTFSAIDGQDISNRATTYSQNIKLYTSNVPYDVSTIYINHSASNGCTVSAIEVNTVNISTINAYSNSIDLEEGMNVINITVSNPGYQDKTITLLVNRHVYVPTPGPATLELNSFNLKADLNNSKIKTDGFTPENSSQVRASLSFTPDMSTSLAAISSSVKVAFTIDNTQYFIDNFDTNLLLKSVYGSGDVNSLASLILAATDDSMGLLSDTANVFVNSTTGAISIVSNSYYSDSKVQFDILSAESSEKNTLETAFGMSDQTTGYRYEFDDNTKVIFNVGELSYYLDKDDLDNLFSTDINRDDIALYIGDLSNGDSTSFDTYANIIVDFSGELLIASNSASKVSMCISANSQDTAYLQALFGVPQYIGLDPNSSVVFNINDIDYTIPKEQLASFFYSGDSDNNANDLKVLIENATSETNSCLSDVANVDIINEGGIDRIVITTKGKGSNTSISFTINDASMDGVDWSLIVSAFGTGNRSVEGSDDINSPGGI